MTTETAKEPVKYLSCAETAKLVRATLKATFPGVKFSVRSSTYSMGASIDVSWVDGPTDSEVRKVTEKYAGATFDGMIDLKSYKDPMLVAFGEGELPVEVHSGADYVLTSRRHSAERLAFAAEYAKAHQCGDGPETVYWTEDPTARGIVGMADAFCSPEQWGLEQAAAFVARHMDAAGEVVRGW